MKKIILDVRNCFIEQLPYLQIIRQTRRYYSGRPISGHHCRGDTLAADTANFGNLPGKKCLRMHSYRHLSNRH